MGNRDTAWHSRKELIVPILVGIIVGVLPSVLPMNWFWILVLWLILAGCVIWLVLILVPSKQLCTVILVGTIILLAVGGFYRTREQWRKDYGVGKSNLRILLFNSDNKYVPGLEVNGVKWREDYLEYVLNISNENDELSDLRAYIEVPWVIVKYDIQENHGTQELKLSQSPQNMFVTGKGSDLIVATFEDYINTLQVDSVKLYPKGSFSIRLILWEWQDNARNNYDGSITVDYRYKGAGNKSLGFLIKHQKNYQQLYVDKDHPILIGQTFNGLFLRRCQKGRFIWNPDGSITYSESGLIPPRSKAMEGLIVEYNKILGFDNKIKKPVRIIVKPPF